MMAVRRLRWLLPWVAAALAAPALAQSGALTIPRNLAELTDRSDIILRGRVMSAQVEKHPEFPNLDTVVVTLRVRESLMGDAGATFTFRQYVWDPRDRRLAGGYVKGQDLLLMMIAPSRYGLSSPAGLDQGRFVIRRDAAGREVASNGIANAGLLDGLASRFSREGKLLAPGLAQRVETHRSGPIAVDELRTLIRTASQGGR